MKGKMWNWRGKSCYFLAAFFIFSFFTFVTAQMKVEEEEMIPPLPHNSSQSEEEVFPTLAVVVNGTSIQEEAVFTAEWWETIKANTRKYGDELPFTAEELAVKANMSLLSSPSRLCPESKKGIECDAHFAGCGECFSDRVGVGCISMTKQEILAEIEELALKEGILPADAARIVYGFSRVEPSTSLADFTHSHLCKGRPAVISCLHSDFHIEYDNHSDEAYWVSSGLTSTSVSYSFLNDLFSGGGERSIVTFPTTCNTTSGHQYVSFPHYPQDPLIERNLPFLEEPPLYRVGWKEKEEKEAKGKRRKRVGVVQKSGTNNASSMKEGEGQHENGRKIDQHVQSDKGTTNASQEWSTYYPHIPYQNSVILERKQGCKKMLDVEVNDQHTSTTGTVITLLATDMQCNIAERDEGGRFPYIITRLYTMRRRTGLGQYLRRSFSTGDFYLLHQGRMLWSIMPDEDYPPLVLLQEAGDVLFAPSQWYKSNLCVSDPCSMFELFPGDE